MKLSLSYWPDSWSREVRNREKRTDGKEKRQRETETEVDRQRGG